MNYQEFKTHSKNVVDTLVMGFAFSNEQFDKLLTEKGWDKDNMVRCTMGGFCPKEHLLDNIKKLNDLTELKGELLKDDDFLYGALLYELYNHEYAYTYDTEQTLESLGLKFDELSDSQKEVLKKATKHILSKYDY